MNFPLSEVRSFVDQLHKNGQHFVPIVDPGIMVYKGQGYCHPVQEYYILRVKCRVYFIYSYIVMLMIFTLYVGYDAYEKGLANGLFVKDITGASYLGQVWPGPTHFPDFFNPEIQVQ